MPRYSLAEFTARADPAHWRALDTTAHAWFATPDMRAGADVATAIAGLADAAGLTPRITLLANRVQVVLTTLAAGDFGDADLELADAVSQLARERGLTALPAHPEVVTIGIDTLDAASIRPFWQALLGFRPDREGSLNDRDGRGPQVWFQQMDKPRPGRNRVHLDVYVPHDQAPARVEAALAAGGRLVTDRFAPSWWVLADAEGNEACVCTWGQPPEGAE